MKLLSVKDKPIIFATYRKGLDSKYLVVLLYSHSRNWFSLSGVCEGPGLAG